MKKQLQTCCKHQTFSLETTERDDTSQGFGSPSRVIHISSPIKEASNPVLQRRKSFNVSHARSLLTTPEPLTPFRKSVESAIPLCRSSTFKSARLQNVKSPPDLARGTLRELTPTEAPPKGKVSHKSGPLPVLQQLFRGSLQGGIISSPLNVKKQLSGPLMSAPRKPLSGAPSPKQSVLGGPSPQRLSKVKFSPTPYDITPNVKLSDMISQEGGPKVKQVLSVKAKKQLAPVLDKRDSRDSGQTFKSECNPVASSPEVKSVETKTPTEAEASAPEHPKEDEVHVVQCRNSNVKEGNTERSNAVDCLEKDYISAAVKIQAAYRGHQTRNKLADELRRASSNPSEDTTEEEVQEARSISTQMSRTDPQKQRRNSPPRVTRGWNGSMRSAQDHQALLRSKQAAALKRERAMEYALSRQRWRTGSTPAKGPIWCRDDRLPDKPGWVRSWLERATRMSSQNLQNRVFNNDFEQNDPQSESLSMKSTVGMCTTDIGSAEVNLGWPLSLRQQHAAGLLQPKTPLPEPPTLHIETPTPPTPLQEKRSNYMTGGVELQEKLRREDLSSCTTDSGVLCSTSDESPPEAASPGNRAHEIESSGQHQAHDADLESVGSCEGPVPTLKKLPSPIVATKPRPRQVAQHKLSNSNSLKEASKRGRLFALHPQSQVSVALSDGNSDDTTAASVQRPLWR